MQHAARIVILGITPGAQQAKNAMVEAKRQLAAGADYEAALAAAKRFAAFSGPMRANLIAMLDHVGIHRWLGVASTAELWSEHIELAHFTSALRYPVFVDGLNYNGQPLMTESPLLRDVIETYLAEEVLALPEAIWVPLGPKPNAALQHLVARKQLDPNRVLAGLPHPSGANAERVAYFVGRKARAALSTKTDPVAIDASRARICGMVGMLPH